MVATRFPEDADYYEYSEYIRSLLSTRDRGVEKLLEERVRGAKNRSPRVVRRRGGLDVFKVKAYVLPSDVYMSSVTGVEKPLRIATNPSIALEDGGVHLYIRFSTLGSHPVPDPRSRTFIGHASTHLSRLKGRLRLSAKPILCPKLSVERVEDPRVYTRARELYHVRAFELYKPIAGSTNYVLTFRAVVEHQSTVKFVEPVRFRGPKGGESIIPDCRDTFPLNDRMMVIRPIIENLGYGAVGVAPRDEALVGATDAVFHPELAPLKGEKKTGGNACARVSPNEILLVFHGVDDTFGYYYSYVALLDDNGELVALTPEPVITPRLREYSGARPATLFVCGALVAEGRVLLSAGKDDEITLILEADVDELMERMKFIRG